MADAGVVKPLKRFAIPDALLYGYGDRDALHEQRGLSTDALASDLVIWISRLRMSPQVSDETIVSPQRRSAYIDF
jgi:hypothetical protein